MGWQDRDYHRHDARPMMPSPLGAMSLVKWLIVINTAVFVWDGIFADSARGSALAIYPKGYFSIETAISGFQLWRWVSYQFLHGDFWHLLFNMLFLFFFGPLIERWWGSRRFLAFYLLCGVSGAFVMAVLAIIAPEVILPQTPTVIPINQEIAVEVIPLVGASGSIFGILVACAVLYPHQRVMLMFPPIPMSMRTLALIFLGIAVLKVIVGHGNAGGEAAHLGGALLGFLLIRYPAVLTWPPSFLSSAARRRPGRWERRQQVSQRDDAEVDRILTKVKEHGLHGLTRREKKILQKATEKQRRTG